MSYTYEDKLNFIVSIYCAARRVSFETGLSWKTMLAQAAQETGWGEKVLSDTNNIFNIKADGQWTGRTKTFKVHEYDSRGNIYYVDSKFAVYESLEESFRDRVSFLKRNPRYSSLFSPAVLGVFEKEAQALQDAGYATDPKYADYLIQVFNGKTMRRALERSKSKANCAVTATLFEDTNGLARNVEVEISTDGGLTYYKKVTNSGAIVEGITTELGQNILFKFNDNLLEYQLDFNREQAIKVIHIEDSYITKTQKHETNNIPNTPNHTANSSNTSSISNNQKHSKASTTEATFNIKLVEADTGNPLPNTTYYLEYKNNIKKHVTDSEGIDSNIKADICESINVLLDEDNGKKQTIGSLAFPVTQDLNNTTKVLAIPVVSLSIKFMDAHNQPIPNYQFTTLYRGRSSSVKQANSQGVAKLKALAGQKLTIIDGHKRAKTTAYVTDGSHKWTVKIGQHQALEDSNPPTTSNSANTGSTNSDTANNSPSDTKDSDNPQLTVEKPSIKEQEVITDRGPTLEVESDEVLVNIKFVDKDTGKPLSGLTYFTETKKYGRRTSVTGSDGTRGKAHESLVGIVITVIVYEDGQEVVKGEITSRHGHDEPYIFEAKKPTWHHPLARMELRGWYSNTQWTPHKSDYKGRTGGRHDGVDLYAPLGTELYACVDGEVYEYYTSATYGKVIGIKGVYRDKTYYFFYAHLSSRAISEGSVVAGQVIGKTGNTGNVDKSLSKGYHLHFEVRTTPNRVGGRINPYVIEELKDINKNPNKNSQR